MLEFPESHSRVYNDFGQEPLGTARGSQGIYCIRNSRILFVDFYALDYHLCHVL